MPSSFCGKETRQGITSSPEMGNPGCEGVPVFQAKPKDKGLPLGGLMVPFFYSKY